jgi:hypothetical protein
VELYIVWKFLHVVTLFFAIALAISGELVVRRVAGTRDVSAIRTVVERVRPLSGNLASLLLLAGIVFGFLTALAGGIDLLRPWLVIAYVAVAAAVVIGVTITDPWIDRLAKAAAASPDDAPSGELVAVIDDPRARYATVALMVLIVILVFTMVVKPLGA